MSPNTFLDPADLPTANGYSHVAKSPSGSLVWVSGQMAIDADGNLPHSDWEGQTRLAFENVGRGLKAGGADWADVVKFTFFVTDIAGLAAIRAVRNEFIDTERAPTSSLVQIAGLVHPGALIEIEAVAAVG
jgi:enamine deaminase RidA (YjgF/YER057c/UK114 family)